MLFRIIYMTLMNWFGSLRVRWNILINSNAKSCFSSAYLIRYTYTNFLSSIFSLATFFTTAENNLETLLGSETENSLQCKWFLVALQYLLISSFFLKLALNS